MAAVHETVGAARPVQFVALVTDGSGAGQLGLRVICPSEQPLSLPRAGDAARHLTHAAEVEIGVPLRPARRHARSRSGASL